MTNKEIFAISGRIARALKSSNIIDVPLKKAKQPIYDSISSILSPYIDINTQTKKEDGQTPST